MMSAGCCAPRRESAMVSARIQPHQPWPRPNIRVTGCKVAGDPAVQRRQRAERGGFPRPTARPVPDLSPYATKMRDSLLRAVEMPRHVEAERQKVPVASSKRL
jgi:hypothetical protein